MIESNCWKLFWIYEIRVERKIDGIGSMIEVRFDFYITNKKFAISHFIHVQVRTYWRGNEIIHENLICWLCYFLHKLCKCVECKKILAHVVSQSIMIKIIRTLSIISFAMKQCTDFKINERHEWRRTHSTHSSRFHVSVFLLLFAN